MKAVFIDVEKGEIRDIEFKGKLEDFYHYIHCDIVDAVPFPDDENHDVVVDDEGLLKKIVGFFSIYDDSEPQYAGNGIIVGVNNNVGKWISSKYSAEDIKRRITFWTVKYTPMGNFLVKQPSNEE